MSMNEVIPWLWVGDLDSALDAANLKAHGIGGILSALVYADFEIEKTFVQHRVPLIDNEEEKILDVLHPSIQFIQNELEKGHGVLVHCFAGISRSVSIVAAYLMYTKNIDQHSALQIIRAVRPSVSPNLGFQCQLDLFYERNFAAE